MHKDDIYPGVSVCRSFCERIYDFSKKRDLTQNDGNRDQTNISRLVNKRAPVLVTRAAYGGSES